MKKTFLILGIIGIIAYIIFAIKRPTITINTHVFNLYIAKAPNDKEVGLSKYNNLPQNYGMIFPFQTPALYPFWMKDMKFPIDILFIKDNTIVTIYNNIPNPKTKDENLMIYVPKSPANLVLEIQAGISKKYNFKEGDAVILKNL